MPIRQPVPVLRTAFLTRAILVEMLRTAAMCALAAIGAALLALMVADTSFREFFQNVHLDRDGAALAESFSNALSQSIPILLAAGALLVAGAILTAWVGEKRRFGFVKPLATIISSCPSFLLPLLPFLIPAMYQGLAVAAGLPKSDGTLFEGLPDGGIFLPAICLAIGDFNLSAVSTQLRESIRFAAAQPHIQTLRTLGKPLWYVTWPQLCVTLLTSVSGRVPHLIGGLVALEILFNINGVGIRAYNGVTITPPDIHWILWLCLFCVAVRSCLRILELLFRAVFLPNTFVPSPGEQEQSLSEDHPGESRDESETTSLRTEEIQRLQRDWVMASDGKRPAGMFKRICINIAYYANLRRGNRTNMGIALVCVIAFLLLLCACWFYGEVAPTVPLADPALWSDNPSTHLLGTDSAGVDIISAIRIGLVQMIIPMLVALVAGLLPAMAALASLYNWRSTGDAMRNLLWCVDRCCVFVAEFVESMPKLLVLLAVFSSLPGGLTDVTVMGTTFSLNVMMIQLFFVIGVMHAPQFYSALRHDISAINDSIYIEAARQTGMRLRDLIFVSLLKNHCLHALSIQAVAVVAGVLHYDAVLGFVGIRLRGVIFTWGSQLGMGVEAYMQYGRLDFFNPWVLGLPMLIVWLGIVFFAFAAEALKTFWGGYVYRLR